MEAYEFIILYQGVFPKMQMLHPTVFVLVS